MNKTSIEWTDFTSNPIRARRQLTPASKPNIGHYCEKTSPGCKNCYASALQKRFGMPSFSEARREDVEPYLDRNELQKLLKRRKPCKVFLGDMTDIFGDWVPDEWLDQIFAVMALTPHVTYQLLTKRAERMREYFDTDTYRDDIIAMRAKELHTSVSPFRLPSGSIFDSARVAKNERWQIVTWPLPNVWLGVSCENYEYAAKRIPELLQTPAAVRFVSAEPLLGTVDFRFLPVPNAPTTHTWDVLKGSVYDAGQWPVDATDRLDWIIIGGESGKGARPCDLTWIRSIVEQCQAAGTSCFVKQAGSRPIDSSYEAGIFAERSIAAAKSIGSDYVGFNLVILKDSKGGNPEEWEPWPWMRKREFPVWKDGK